MSWQALKWTFAQTTGSATKKAVLAGVAEAANGKTGTCTLSIATIAARTELGERAVWGALLELERDGFIRRDRRTDGRGHRTSDLITLCMAQVAPDAVREPAPNSREVRSGGGRPTRTTSAAKSHVVQPLLAPGATEPVVEPGDEPEFSLVAHAPREKASRKRPATALPVDCPAERDLLWAQGQLEARAPHLRVEDQAARFRDHHLSRDTRFSDWSAAWRTWIHKAPEFSRPRASPAGQSALAWAVESDR
jgi:hypothetical protein